VQSGDKFFPSGARDQIPIVCQLGLAGPAGSRIGIHDRTTFSQPRQRHQRTVSGAQVDIGNERTLDVNCGTVVDRRGSTQWKL